ncbi:hypothetical protein [Streptomyces avicenniae]|uniref:hypothetical protein n=1 Tax=Streptomyces avicenniae TaxID=500153 RepID=UPI00069B0DAC|nr:hypothetical protein [Streptomyces avicenniae]
MNLPRHCDYCGTAIAHLVAVAAVASGSGPGWSYHACRACRVSERLVPLVAHPSDSWGGMRYWPDVVPRELVVRLADLGEAPQLRAVADRLFPAVAVAASRTADDRARGAAGQAAEAAVAALWDATAAVPHDER